MSRLQPGPVAATAFAVLLLLLAIAPIANNDIWLHLATGERILDERTMPRADAFTFTRAAEPWISHEWLAQALFALAHRLGGTALLSILYAVVTGAVLWLVHHEASRSLVRGREAGTGEARGLSALITLAVFFLMLSFLSIRPHMATFLLAASCAALLRRLDSDDAGVRRRAFLALAAQQILWANLHGGFVTGILLAAIHAAGSLLRGLPTASRAALPFVLAALSCLNPYGWRIYELVGRFADTTFRRVIVEWRTPFEPRFAATPAFWVWVVWTALALAGAVRAVRREKDHVPWMTVLALGAMAAGSRRHISLMAVVTAPAAARGLAALASRLSSGRDAIAARRAGWAAAAATVAVAAWLGWARLSDREMPLRPGLIARNIPVEALEMMQAEGLRGRVFTSIGLGSWITWRGRPALTTSIDSRLELFGGRFIEEHLAAARDPRRFGAFAAAHPFDMALLPWRLVSVRGALAAMKLDPAWALVYVDDTVMLHLRRTPGHEAIIARREYRVLDPVRFLSGGGAGPVSDPAGVEEARRAAHDPPVLPNRPPVNTIARRMAGLP